MKKLLRYGNVVALGIGSLAMALLTWMLESGTDSKGLYPANHPGWILMNIVTVVSIVGFWLVSRHAGNNRNFRQNFPASILASLGYAAAGVGLLFAGLDGLETKTSLGFISGMVGIASVVPMIWTAVLRLRGQRTGLAVHMLPCFFFALQLFALGQEFGAEPEMYRYLYRFFAAASMVPACYCLWSFDVNLGKRTACIFWCLVAGYCNLVAVVHGQQMLLHFAMAGWMLTALPKLCYLPKQAKPAKDSAPVAQEPEADPLALDDLCTPEDTRATVIDDAPIFADITPANDSLWQIPQPIQEEPPSVPDPLAVELPDADAILEELLRDFGHPEDL